PEPARVLGKDLGGRRRLAEFAEPLDLILRELESHLSFRDRGDLLRRDVARLTQQADRDRQPVEDVVTRVADDLVDHADLLAAVAGRVERRQQQRTAFEVVRRVESDLPVDVAPVRWERGERPLPLRTQRLARSQLLRRCLLRADELELARDALLVEAFHQPAHGLGTDSAAAPRDSKTDLLAESAGIGGSEQRPGPGAARV